MIYNEVDLSDKLRIVDVRGRGLPTKELKTIRVPGSKDVYVTSRESTERYLEIDYRINANDKEGLRLAVDELSSIFNVDGEVSIVFPDEPEMTYFGEYAGAIENRELYHIGIHTGTINILRKNNKYGPEKSATGTNNLTIHNQGTAETEPIFELTATKKTTFAMVSDGEEYNIIGRPADVEEQLVDEKTLKVDERGDSLDTWSTSGANVDGSVTGTLTTDGTGIVANVFGTGTLWHGPALIKEINPIQDFEVEMRVEVNQTNPNQTYRIEFYLFDENMTELGKMAVVDRSSNRSQYSLEGRFGKYLGTYVNYPISARNYTKYMGKFHGMLRIRRIGNRFEFYVARIGVRGIEFQHFDTLTEYYNDVEKQYAGKLKYVEIHIGKYGSTNAPPAPNMPKIHSFRVFEHNRLTVDQTPYILTPGDVVTLDHKDEEILINGEPRMDLKNFGGSFFDLPKGQSTILISPEDSFDSKVTYRDKYL